ncbi:MAG TPA: hypothetical protein VMW78_01280 [Anaerolineae bacterium]|nr:hypothetical protein [Anaerolineae bacterium]
MDFIEKTRIRMENWITHNDHHQKEYEILAKQLETAGKNKSSEHVKEMIKMAAKSNDFLRNALKALD